MFYQQICRQLQFLSWVFTLSISTLVVLPTTVYSETTPEIQKQNQVFPVDLSIAGQDISTNILIRSSSQEKSNHNHWLLPIDKVAQALNLQVIPVNKQQLELRSPAHIIRIPTEDLALDPQLGLVVSLAKLENLLAVNSEVNEENQTINLTPQWLALRTETLASQNLTATPQLIPEIDIIALNSQNTILGKAFGGEWYIRTYQPDLFNPTSVYVHDIKYSHQSDAADYLLGIQPQSWLGQNRGNFLGFTTIKRWGFTPLTSPGNYLSLLQRLQANQVGRDITGKTTPGTIVKVLKPNSSEVIAETVSTAGGDYHFDNIPSLPGGVTQYQVAFYNRGNLEPREVKTIKLTTMSNQLPMGASALLIAGGVTQEIALDQGFLGKIDDLQTEIGYRYGLTEDLTMGINLGYNNSVRAIGELLYQPTHLPVQITLAMLNSPDIDGFYLTSNLRLQPASNLIVNFNSDRLTRNIALNWQALPHLNLTLQGNNQQTNWSSSLRLAYEKQFLATIATLQLNQEEEISWSLTSRLGHFQFNYADSPTYQQTELSYNLFQQAHVGHGYWLFINYKAHEFLETQNNLTTIGWRYRSTPELDSGGFWEVSCGYGVGTLGNGVILTLSRELVPGLRLQLDYKTVSTLANDGAFALRIVPNFDIFSNSRQWEF